MNKRNYQKEMEEVLKELQVDQKGRPSLVLHSCCGPCSSYVMKVLTDFFDLSLFYYNPNIHPQAEYEKRLQTQRELCEKMPFTGKLTFLSSPYDPERFFAQTKGLEEEKEGGSRCEVCFRLRLEETAKEAKRQGADFFTTTLSVSPHKNAPLLNAIGEELAKKYQVNYLVADFKKKEGYKQSVQLAKTYDLYRQDYCGCIYSLRQREEEKAAQEAQKGQVL